MRRPTEIGAAEEKNMVAGPIQPDIIVGNLGSFINGAKKPMAIVFQCGCGKQLQVRDDLAGKKARCPGCGTVLAVPSPRAESARITRKRPEADVARAASRRPDRPARDAEDSDETSPVALGDTSHSGDDQPRRRFKQKRKRSASSILFFPL